MDIAVIGLDLGKTVCSVAGLDERGAVVFRRRLQRFRLLDFLAKLPPCVVAMEACGGAHHIGRFCFQHGHEPRLMPPVYVRPYVKVHKNDDRDAEAIAEAATRPRMSFVAVKSEAQLDLQALHRTRERLIHSRTALINQARGFLMERGVRIATGRHVFERAVASLLIDPRHQLSPAIVSILSDMVGELGAINKRVAQLDAEIASQAQSDSDMRRLMGIPGIGPTIASALVAAVGDGACFARARDLSAWLGLVPRQISTGGKARLVGISKRGNRYLRKLFIHGARAVVHRMKDRTSPIARWADGLTERSHANVAAVAMANKLVRIAWAVLTKRENYRPSALAGASVV